MKLIGDNDQLPRRAEPSEEGATEEITGENDEILELMFDPVLNCYFDPKTNKYYELC